MKPEAPTSISRGSSLRLLISFGSVFFVISVDALSTTLSILVTLVAEH